MHYVVFELRIFQVLFIDFNPFLIIQSVFFLFSLCLFLALCHSFFFLAINLNHGIMDLMSQTISVAVSLGKTIHRHLLLMVVRGPNGSCVWQPLLSVCPRSAVATM